MGCSSSNTSGGGRKEARAILIGLAKAGKTTILYRLKLGELVTTIPTIGFNVETVPGARGYTFDIWDVGGAPRIRLLWRHYYCKIDVVIFVVDSSDREDLKVAKDVLFGDVLSSTDLRGVPLLVLANKTDIPGAMTPSDIQKELHLKAIIDRTWVLNPVCAVSGEGLDVAMADLTRLVMENRNRRAAASNNKMV